MPKKDFTQVAFDVVQQATGEAPMPPAKTAKQEAGHKGGIKGGAKRMADLTAEERKDLALKAAGARWNKKPPVPQETTGGSKR